MVPRWREKYKELIRIKFRQNDGFCECCDLWSIRNVATRDIRPPAEDDCNKTIIKCAQYATLTYVEDESRSIVYYETDVMSDSRSILFEYLFSNARISASGLLRCGGVDTNEISWTSYDEKRDAELEKDSKILQLGGLRKIYQVRMHQRNLLAYKSLDGNWKCLLA